MRTIIYGPPGTGKTYTLLKHIEEFLTKTDTEKLDILRLVKMLRKKVNRGRLQNLN